MISTHCTAKIQTKMTDSTKPTSVEDIHLSVYSNGGLGYQQGQQDTPGFGAVPVIVGRVLLLFLLWPTNSHSSAFPPRLPCWSIVPGKVGDFNGSNVTAECRIWAWHTSCWKALIAFHDKKKKKHIHMTNSNMLLAKCRAKRKHPFKEMFTSGGGAAWGKHDESVGR